MAHMSNKTRQCIIEVAKSKGFSVRLKADRTDLYDKNIVFTSGAFSALPVYIDKVTGISPVSGEINYLKVAVHPDAFVVALVNPAQGIEESINRRLKINRHHSSNYRGFPRIPESREPYGKCYQVHDLHALSVLLAGLTGSKA